MKDHGGTHPFKPIEEYPVQLKDNDYWTIVSDAMQAVISSSEGTAGSRFGRNTPYTVAAKTGTAQVFSGDQYEKKQYSDIPEALRNHTLFISFAPVEDPEIAIAILVENDNTAVGIARKVMDAYFELKTS